MTTLETQNGLEGPRELDRPWGSGVGSGVGCSDVTSSYGPAVTSRSLRWTPIRTKHKTLSRQKYIYVVYDYVDTYTVVSTVRFRSEDLIRILLFNRSSLY